MMRWIACIGMLAGIVSAVMAPGCAQSTDSGQGLGSLLGQDASGRTKVELNFDIDNGPDGMREQMGCVAPNTGMSLSRSAEDGDTDYEGAGAFNQVVIIWNDLGTDTGVTPSQTGGAQTGTQTTTPTQTVTADTGVSFVADLVAALFSRVQSSSDGAGQGDAATDQNQTASDTDNSDNSATTTQPASQPSG